MMWQKFNRVNVDELINARIQLLNAIQLVSAAPRTYLNNPNDPYHDWLFWDEKNNTISSTSFGKKEKVHISLDIEQFVLSLNGKKDHKEHLVLSGMTYPMAFGWMKIKFDTFGLPGEDFNDETEYAIEKVLGVNEELNVTDQDVFSNITIYLSNASSALNKLKSALNIEGQAMIDPSTLSLVFVNGSIIFGFTPGNRIYTDPYFFINLGNGVSKNQKYLSLMNRGANSNNPNEFILLAGDFINLDPEKEEKKVLDFFKTKFQILHQ